MGLSKPIGESGCDGKPSLALEGAPQELGALGAHLETRLGPQQLGLAKLGHWCDAT